MPILLNHILGMFGIVIFLKFIGQIVNQFFDLLLPPPVFPLIVVDGVFFKGE